MFIAIASDNLVRISRVRDAIDGTVYTDATITIDLLDLSETSVVTGISATYSTTELAYLGIIPDTDTDGLNEGQLYYVDLNISRGTSTLKVRLKLKAEYVSKFN